MGISKKNMLRQINAYQKNLISRGFYLFCGCCWLAIYWAELANYPWEYSKIKIQYFWVATIPALFLFVQFSFPTKLSWFITLGIFISILGLHYYQYLSFAYSHFGVKVDGQGIIIESSIYLCILIGVLVVLNYFKPHGKKYSLTDKCLE